MRGKMEELPFIKLTLYFSLFKTYLNKVKYIASTKNSQEFLASAQVSIMGRNKANNSSTSN